MQKGGGYLTRTQTWPSTRLESNHGQWVNNDRTNSLPYRQLPGSTFTRILRIHPGFFSEPIRCRLIPIDFRESDLQYEGISYVWGTEEPRHHVTILDETTPASWNIPVKPNLESALRHLRHVEYDRDVWADAICINQADLEERSQQVRLMSAIYSNANKILIWLGPDVDGGGREVLGAVTTIAPLIQSRIPHGSSAEDVSLDAIVQQYGDRAVEIFETALRFYHHPWLGRIWCLGEIVRAYSALLVCGHACAEWNALSLVTAVAKAANRFPHAGLDNAYLVDLLRSEDSEFPKLPLFRLLNLTRHYGVTDARDRVYALKGLVHRIVEPGFDIKPDYTKSLAAVYEGTARAIFEKEQNLSLLNCIQHRNEADLDDRPTWIPRWDRRCSHVLAPFDRIAASLWSLSRDTTLVPTLTQHLSGELSCHGADLGQVTRVFSIETYDYSDDIRAGCILQLWREVRNEYRLTYPSKIQDRRLRLATDVEGVADPELSQCFVRVLMGGLLDARTKEDDELKRVSETVVRYWLTDEESTPDGFEEATSTASEVIDTVVTACRGRALFFTNTGLLGLGSRITKSGDIVSLLHTAPLPVVLRRHEQHEGLFLVVGETYVRLPTAEVCEIVNPSQNSGSKPAPSSSDISSTWVSRFSPQPTWTNQNNSGNSNAAWSNLNNTLDETFPIIELGAQYDSRDAFYDETLGTQFWESITPTYNSNCISLSSYRRRRRFPDQERLSRSKAVLLLEPWRSGCEITREGLEEAGLTLRQFFIG